MKQNETDSTLRRIPFELFDITGAPLTSPSISFSNPPAAGEVQISKGGAAFSNVSGSVVEIGAGSWYYQASQADTDTLPWVVLKVVKGIAQTFKRVEPIGKEGIPINETVASKRRLLIELIDSSGAPVTSSTVTFSNPPAVGEVQISKNGGAFVNVTGSIVEIGAGSWYYQMTAGDVDTLGMVTLKVVKSGVQNYKINEQVLALFRYTMRAFKTTSPTGFVYWDVFNVPDTTGAFSPFSPADLTDIVIVSTVLL